MDKTIITLKAWNRPEYFAKVFEGLEKCILRNRYEGKVIVSIDRTDPDLIAEMAKQIETSKISSQTQTFASKERMGCAGNTISLLYHAFEKEKADHVIHLEDDTVPGGDYIEYMMWAYSMMKDNPRYFASCTFNRASVKETVPAGTIGSCYEKAWFESGGGFGMPQRTWEFIKSKGGMFGAIGNTSPDIVGIEWKNKIQCSQGGSWAWPFNAYFRERSMTEHLCIFPCHSRVQNIGAKGFFTPSPEWYDKNIITDDWVENDPKLNEPYKFELVPNYIALPNE
jgi:hypothetical protein